jgi:hypothetical protein
MGASRRLIGMSLRGRSLSVSVFVSVLLLLSLTPATGIGRNSRRLPVVEVRVPPHAVWARLPRSFLGLSMEYNELPALDANPRLLERVLGLLRVPGDGPESLRVGGDSADRTFWREPLHRVEFRALHLTPQYFARLRALVLGAHLRLLLDLNLAARDPDMARAFARRALAVLPRRSVAAFEVGNEPDIYHREPFYRLAAVADVGLGSPGAWGHYSAGHYAAWFHTYAHTLPAGVPVAGPELANPGADFGWMQRLVLRDRASLGLLTAHRYPLSDCARPGSPLYPTIARVLSRRASLGLARSVAPAVRLARRRHLSFRLTELNSVTCGGRRGVSNTFATALWAPDALFALWRAGVDGVNVHVRAHKVNGAFAVRAGRLVARPLLYGLLTFARALGPGAELLATRVHAPRRTNIDVWAVRVPHHGLNIVALDRTRHAVRLSLRLPARGTATVQRLTAPGVRSTQGETLAGQRLGPGGRWLGEPRTERVRAAAGRYWLTLPAFSGALVSLRASR